jgi:hypothetical protein
MPLAPLQHFESLEPRRLFAAFTLFADAITDPFALPSPALGLPQEGLQLPPPNIGGAGDTLPDQSLAAVSLVGSYKGGAGITGVSGTRLLVDITDQSPGTITASIRLPALGVSLSGSVSVTFTGNRRFTFQFSQQSTSATVAARLNRDHSLTGQFDLVTSGLHRSGTFAVHRRATVLTVTA